MNCIIVHGCTLSSRDKTYNKHWIPWVTKELISRGVMVESPLMPKPWVPDYNAYKKVLEKHIIDQNSILVGHSASCAFLVRWLGETKRRIKKLILVAPWDSPRDAALNKNVTAAFRNFLKFPIDPTIPSRIDKIIFFTSDNADEDCKETLKRYRKSLGGTRVELKGYGHYVIQHMKTKKFPELVEKIVAS